ncbi:MAG: AzlD domain-containing protein [Desulfobacteraceae bacterium]|nr:MAG: AzlD domain-containing protein [Desulfobacteraceae bacterium]
MDNLIPLILGMAAVTYGPRMIPFFLISGTQLPVRVDAFLKCIPIAAIGALIIPGVFSAIPGSPLAVVMGMGFALIVGFWRGGIVIPVIGSVAAAYMVLWLSQ